MAFWWVLQDDHFEEEREGNYLWAPKTGKYYWTNLKNIQPGDIIFSHLKGEIVALGVALTYPKDEKIPFNYDEKEKRKTGIRVGVSFFKLENPIKIKEMMKDIKDRLTEKDSPLDKNGKCKQGGYCFEIPNQAGRFLLEKIYINLAK